MDRYSELYGEEAEWTDTQQVCLNGHVITDYAVSQPATTRKHCPDCGAETITACTNCGSTLRGYRHIPGVIGLSASFVGKLCPDCGKPYPWTEAERAVVLEWIGSLPSLQEASKEEMIRLLPAIFSDTPRTSFACHRLLNILRELPEEESAPFLTTLVDVACVSAATQLRQAPD